MLKILIPFLFISSFAQAYILPSRIILQKTVENAGTGIYAIEQEVQFPNGNDNLILKESWLIENDHSMRLTVTGTKDLQSQIHMQFVYSGGSRHSLNGTSHQSQKISEDFVERFLNFRSVEAFASHLVALKMAPSNFLQAKPTKANDFKYEPESFLRYSRVGGIVAYAFGVPTSPEKEVSNPGIWIEQDQFVVRKIRLPSQVEMSAESYSQFAKGLNYPRQRVIRWGNNSVNIRLISATARRKAQDSFQPNSVNVATKLDGLANQVAKDAVIDFYTRCR